MDGETVGDETLAFQFRERFKNMDYRDEKYGIPEK